jgi:hypothetical protein
MILFSKKNENYVAFFIVVKCFSLQIVFILVIGMLYHNVPFKNATCLLEYYKTKR